MIELNKQEYYKASEMLQKVTLNNLFARSVIEKKVDGCVYVDSINNPKTFYVVHPYGMSLLFGDWNNSLFNSAFREYALNKGQKRERYEWMQTFPNDWESVLAELFKDSMIKASENVENREVGIVEQNTRVNFKFNQEKYQNLKNAFSNFHLDKNIKIVRVDENNYKEMKGAVIPLNFWNKIDASSVGFSLYYENDLASTSFSAFIHDNKLELGIETVEKYRGMKLAQYVCSVLIDYCIENNYEPVWSCRLENVGSYKLAHGIGFEPVLEIPYYRLSK